jgi:selenium-binding protein 1
VRANAWAVRKVIEIPAEPADPQLLPPMLKSFGAVPPLVTDTDLSMDDRFLYVSCWGTGDMLQYDVSDSFAPKLSGTVRIGGIVSGRHIRKPAKGNSMAGRRWSRSVAMGRASTSPIRYTG